MTELSVPVDELLRTTGQVPWPEVLAVLQGLIDARTDDPGRARLDADGRLVAEPGPQPTVTALAQLLQRLLPPPQEPSDPRVPAALRYSLIRALGGVTAPPFASVEDFSRTLARFERGDRGQLLRSLYERSQQAAKARTGATPAPPAVGITGGTPAPPAVRPTGRTPAPPAVRPTGRTPAPPAVGITGGTPAPPAVRPTGRTPAPPAVGPTGWTPAPPAVEQPQARVAWDSWPLEGRPSPVERRSAVSAERQPPRRVTVAAARTPRTKKRAGPVLSALVALSLLVAGIVVGAAVFVHADGRRPSAILDAIGPQVTRVKEWVADVRAAVSTPDARRGSEGTDRSTSQEGGSTTKEGGATSPHPDDVPAPSRSPETLGTSGADGTRERARSQPPSSGPEMSSSRGKLPSSAPQTPAAPTAVPSLAPEAPSSPTAAPDASALAPDTQASLPGQLVVALDLGRKPVFSPSFASDGTAVFYDEDSGAAGSALKEARTGGDKLLHVLSVLDDGARNYHPQLSPDGTTVAFDSDRDGVRGVYLSDRAGGNIRRVSGEGYAAVPSWSPDGRRLAFIKAEPDNPRVWNVWLLDMTSGAMRQLTRHRVGQPWGASWLPDRRRICYSHEDRLIVLDTQSGASRVYPSPRKGVLVRTPAVSPDGRQVIFQLYRHGAWLLDLDDGSMRQVLDDPTAEEFAWSPDGSRVAFHSRREKQWGIRVMDTPSPNPGR